MENNNISGNSQDHKPDEKKYSARDWREARWEWRQERRDARWRYPFHALSWGLTLVLLGGLFLAIQQGWIADANWWQYLLIGVGSILIINGLVRLADRSYPYSGFWTITWGLVLIAIGGSFLLGISQWWPLILVFVGVVMLFRFFQLNQHKNTN